ncbi:hypothetical protein [Sorangium sp. So ce388]|uniref:hypothetical protein n=1 Tax=Sorangium sp. So ce388 TaxID=3133309 RepID=UPI003F5CB5A5
MQILYDGAFETKYAQGVAFVFNTVVSDAADDAKKASPDPKFQGCWEVVAATVLLHHQSLYSKVTMGAFSEATSPADVKQAVSKRIIPEVQYILSLGVARSMGVNVLKTELPTTLPPEVRAHAAAYVLQFSRDCWTATTRVLNLVATQRIREPLRVTKSIEVAIIAIVQPRALPDNSPPPLPQLSKRLSLKGSQNGDDDDKETEERMAERPYEYHILTAFLAGKSILDTVSAAEVKETTEKIRASLSERAETVVAQVAEKATAIAEKKHDNEPAAKKEAENERYTRYAANVEAAGNVITQVLKLAKVDDANVKAVSAYTEFMTTGFSSMATFVKDGFSAAATMNIVGAALSLIVFLVDLVDASQPKKDPIDQVLAKMRNLGDKLEAMTSSMNYSFAAVLNGIDALRKAQRDTVDQIRRSAETIIDTLMKAEVDKMELDFKSLYSQAVSNLDDAAQFEKLGDGFMDFAIAKAPSAYFTHRADLQGMENLTALFRTEQLVYDRDWIGALQRLLEYPSKTKAKETRLAHPPSIARAAMALVQLLSTPAARFIAREPITSKCGQWCRATLRQLSQIGDFATFLRKIFGQSDVIKALKAEFIDGETAVRKHLRDWATNHSAAALQPLMGKPMPDVWKHFNDAYSRTLSDFPSTFVTLTTKAELKDGSTPGGWNRYPSIDVHGLVGLVLVGACDRPWIEAKQTEIGRDRTKKKEVSDAGFSMKGPRLRSYVDDGPKERDETWRLTLKATVVDFIFFEQPVQKSYDHPPDESFIQPKMQDKAADFDSHREVTSRCGRQAWQQFLQSNCDNLDAESRKAKNRLYALVNALGAIARLTLVRDLDVKAELEKLLTLLKGILDAEFITANDREQEAVKQREANTLLDGIIWKVSSASGASADIDYVTDALNQLTLAEYGVRVYRDLSDPLVAGA